MCASQSSSGTLAIDPPAGVPGEPNAFESAIYKNLAGPGASLHDKVKAGYKLIDAQRKDLSKMKGKLSDLEKSVMDKSRATTQL